MPQMMPLFWMNSSILVLLLLMMYMKIYGNFFNMNSYLKKNSINNNINKWYW